MLALRHGFRNSVSPTEWIARPVRPVNSPPYLRLDTQSATLWWRYVRNEKGWSRKVTIEAVPPVLPEDPAGSVRTAHIPAPRLRSVPPSRRPLRRVVGATLLRWGVTPYLLLVDVAALAVGVSLAGGLTGGLLIFAVATIWLNATGALYRSRLTLSMLDQAPDLAVRALAAAALSGSVGLVVGVGGRISPLFTAAA